MFVESMNKNYYFASLNRERTCLKWKYQTSARHVFHVLSICLKWRHHKFCSTYDYWRFKQILNTKDVQDLLKITEKSASREFKDFYPKVPTTCF